MAVVHTSQDADTRSRVSHALSLLHLKSLVSTPNGHHHHLQAPWPHHQVAFSPVTMSSWPRVGISHQDYGAGSPFTVEVGLTVSLVPLSLVSAQSNGSMYYSSHV